MLERDRHAGLAPRRRAAAVSIVAPTSHFACAGGRDPPFPLWLLLLWWWELLGAAGRRRRRR